MSRLSLKNLSREDRILLIGIPVLVLAVFVGWVVWRQTTTLGDVEARLLDWSNVLTLAREHLVLVILSGLLVTVTAVPTGILLTRRRTAFLAPVATLLFSNFEV